jgi:hypothetical protein
MELSLVSSENSREHAAALRSSQVWRRRLDLLRRQGSSGGFIAPHRALLTLPLHPSEAWTALILALLLLSGWLLSLKWVSAVWTWFTQYWSNALFEGAGVKHVSNQIGTFIQLDAPYLDLLVGVPNGGIWWSILLLTMLLVLASFIVPRRQMPLIYLMRATAFIQVCTLAYFAITPATFPYTIGSYQSGMMQAGLIFISLVPVLLGATYFIFDFGLFKKLFLSLVTMLHLSVFIPLQYLVHVYLIQKFSMLVLPLLFFMFGLPLDIFVFIAFYAWGMSWKSKRSM